MLSLNCNTSLVVLAAVIAAVAPPTHGASDAPALAPALKSAFEAVRAAHYAGDSQKVWQALSPTVARVHESQIDALNRALAAEEIPSVEELLVEVRLKLVQQGLASALPEPVLRERLLILGGLEQRITGILQAQAAHPLLMADAPMTRDLETLERELWDLHVLTNELLVAFRCARYAEDLARDVPDGTFERLAAGDKARVALSRVPDYAAIERARRDVLEADLARRLHRLETGVGILADETFRRERFLAAYSTQLDARVLAAFFADLRTQADPPPLARKSLSDPEAPGRVDAFALEAGQRAGELGERSRWYFEGLHWWLRGRYGAGPDVGGLAKSAAAAELPGGLVWLSMPAQPPQPADPADPATLAVPAVERRHHYTWAWEDRRVQERASYSVKTSNQTVRQRLPSFW
ncbi:MAG TPA: hypothetical protein VML55_03440 [Planctomycetaceae bacterium]|nr:hypothetical protein [Planctomycetaceae bacterium]